MILYGNYLGVDCVTPRPKRVYGIGNRRVAYVYQGLP